MWVGGRSVVEVEVVECGRWHGHGATWDPSLVELRSALYEIEHVCQCLVSVHVLLSTTTRLLYPSAAARPGLRNTFNGRLECGRLRLIKPSKHATRRPIFHMELFGTEADSPGRRSH